MVENMNINRLFDWVNGRYEEYAAGQISEEQYLSDLDYYKKRLAESEDNVVEQYTTKEERAPAEKINPAKVRSTSIAGLRKKLLEEMKD